MTKGAAKSMAAGQGGALALGQLLVWLLNTVYGVDVPPEIVLALGQVLAGAGWLGARLWQRLFERSQKDWINDLDDIDDAF